MTAAIIMLVLLVIVALYVMGVYNGLVVLRNRVREAWSDIDVQLKRRYDLIPNLVETVKGYAGHEAGTLEKVIAARNMAMAGNHQNVEEVAANENILSGTLKSLFALKEAYPDLKANQNFLKLQDEIRDTEDKIQASRRFYNGNVLALNNKIEMFPSNIIAGMFHFAKEVFFKLDEEEAEAAKKAPAVKF